MRPEIWFKLLLMVAALVVMVLAGSVFVKLLMGFCAGYYLAAMVHHRDA